MWESDRESHRLIQSGKAVPEQNSLQEGSIQMEEGIQMDGDHHPRHSVLTVCIFVLKSNPRETLLFLFCWQGDKKVRDPTKPVISGR